MNLSIRFLSFFRIIILCGNVRFRNVICLERIRGFMDWKCEFCCFEFTLGKMVNL